MWVILIEDIVRTVWDATECSAVTRKLRFESSVISYGSQTRDKLYRNYIRVWEYFLQIWNKKKDKI